MEAEWRGSSILVVDDTPKVVAALEALYGQLGLEVVGHAVNGVDALAKIKQLKPDIVSMDIIMPEMDGIECYRKIRDGEKPAPKVFFMTYLATEPKVLEVYRDEIPEFLFVAKNYSQDSVRTVLNRLYEPHAAIPPKPPAPPKEDGPSVV